MNKTTPVLLTVATACVLATWGCSGNQKAGTSEGAGVLAPSSVSVSVSQTGRTAVLGSPAASPSPSPVPPIGSIAGIPAATSCPLGKGVVDAACARGVSTLQPAVDEAVNAVVRERPELFDFTRRVGEDGWYVLNVEGFYTAVAARLSTAGRCASYDFVRVMLQVKEGNAVSEDFELVLSNSHIRRGAGSYRSSCMPASFPVDPADVIDDVRVAFYSVLCEGRTPPRNGEGILPVDCMGIATATPKKADNTDVDSRLHGAAIEWELIQADDYVKIHDFNDVPFNKYVTGLDPGPFLLCATVLGKQGCLKGMVVE